MTGAERVLAYVRGAFCCVIFGMFLLNNGPAQPRFLARALLEGGAALLGVATSLVILSVSRRRILRRRDLRLSVAADALICMTGLLAPALVPREGYAGVFSNLDVAAVLLVVLGSIFRVDWSAVLLAGGLNLLGLLCVVLVDRTHGFEVPADKVRLFLTYVAGAVAISAYTTLRARAWLGRLTAAVRRSERAKNSVNGLLHDHHDLRSVLFDIQLNVDRSLERLAKGESALAKRLLGRASMRLAEFSITFESTRDRSLIVLNGLETPEPADVEVALQRAAESFRETPGREVHFELPSGPLWVVFGGGTMGLGLLLGHLMDNAARGSGGRQATTVRIVVALRKGRVSLVVDDDGPGFDDELLATVGKRRIPSTRDSKRGGVGLWLSARSIEGVGGEIVFSNESSLGGARVAFVLPAVGTELNAAV